MSATTLTSHKDAATSFLRLAASGEVERAFATYTAPNFRHHNPYFRGDAKSLASAMAENAAQNPQKQLRVERVIEEGDLVAVHGRVRHNPTAPEIALVHIFRFEGDRIAELWDIGQAPPESSPNEYGMF
jgi:predicted SnoaL-like aldol condensation-catalyzing enzyme